MYLGFVRYGPNGMAWLGTSIKTIKVELLTVDGLFFVPSLGKVAVCQQLPVLSTMKVPSLVIAAAGLAVAQNAAFQNFPDCENGLLAKNKVCDRTLSPPARAAALVAALNSDEKLQNIIRSAYL